MHLPILPCNLRARSLTPREIHPGGFSVNLCIIDVDRLILQRAKGRAGATMTRYANEFREIGCFRILMCLFALGWYGMYLVRYSKGLLNQWEVTS